MQLNVIKRTQFLLESILDYAAQNACYDIATQNLYSVDKYYFLILLL